MDASAGAAKTWKQLKVQLNENRTRKKSHTVNSILEKGELIVQCVTAGVMCMAQNYNDTGP